MDDLSGGCNFGGYKEPTNPEPKHMCLLYEVEVLIYSLQIMVYFIIQFLLLQWLIVNIYVSPC